MQNKNLFSIAMGGWISLVPSPAGQTTLAPGIGEVSEGENRIDSGGCIRRLAIRKLN